MDRDLERFTEGVRRLALHPLQGRPKPREVQQLAESYFRRLREHQVSVDVALRLFATVLDESSRFPTLADLLEMARRDRACTADTKPRQLPAEAAEALEDARNAPTTATWDVGFEKFRETALAALQVHPRGMDAATAITRHVDNLDPARRAAALKAFDDADKQAQGKPPKEITAPVVADVDENEDESRHIIRFRARRRA